MQRFFGLSNQQTSSEPSPAGAPNNPTTNHTMSSSSDVNEREFGQRSKLINYTDDGKPLVTYKQGTKTRQSFMKGDICRALGSVDAYETLNARLAIAVNERGWGTGTVRIEHLLSEDVDTFCKDFVDLGENQDILAGET